MKNEKQQALDVIGRLPDDVSTEAILAELEFVALVRRRQEQAHRGETISHDEAKRRIASWLESAGP